MSEYERYIQTLFEPDDVAEFRLFHKGQAPKQHWALAKECPRFEPRLLELNRTGWNIHLGVNPRTANGVSGDSNVLLARWLFADFDDIETGDGCGRWEFVSDRIFQAGLDNPDMVIHSGHGLHAYWKLSESLTDLDRWRKTQERLILTLDSDPVIKNPERLMRCPGFKNMKHSSSPQDCFIVLWSKQHDKP